MPNDPRIKVVLKRYRKEEEYPDASIELDGMDLGVLRAACRCEAEDFLSKPCELDEQARLFLSTHMGVDFDSVLFDHYLHAYVRKEFVPTYYDDSSVKFKPASESGPPAAIPIPAGMRWISVRPKDSERDSESYG
jgi:hypothetical protein